MNPMKFAIGLALILTAWVLALTLTVHAGQAPPTTSTWSGVYTEEQAEAGLAAYAKSCAECHLEDLAGDGFAPPLKGPEFMNNWNSLSVGDLFERIRISMPPGSPGSVSAKEKADIVAYLLKSGGFPAGTTELAAQAEALKAIKFEATKPGE